MSVLQALDRYYGRMADRGEAEPPGYSRESIGFCIWLDPDGSIANVADLYDYSGRKPVVRRLAVPQAVIRKSNIASNFLWDKTAYALGVTDDTKEKNDAKLLNKKKELTFRSHQAFKTLHAERLAGSTDAGLRALLVFLEAWTPDRFQADQRFTADMLDKNVVFGLAGGDLEFLHDRPAARTLIAAPRGEVWKTAFCLVTGREAPIERLHPAIKGIDGAQTAGALLISYNKDAFTSYGAEQGANAPTSEVAAFRYGTALNRLLDRGSANRLKIADATVAFWADAEGVGEAAATAAEDFFSELNDPPDDASESEKIRLCLTEIAKGRPMESLDPALRPETRFHVLGLSPNAARLSVRFWCSDEFGVFVRRLARHYRDLAIEPAPWRARLPSIQRLLVKTTALLEKFENIPPLLAGELTRAVLDGSLYPRSLLTTAIMRLRAGDDPATGWHAAVIKACINRSEKEKLPMARDPDNREPSYQLGRLFAILEAAQRAALGQVNASIADRYYGAASATPARVFGTLLRTARHHISDAAKQRKGQWIESRLNEIVARLPADLPTSLGIVDQGRFAVGYYHERAWRGPDQNDTAESEPQDNEPGDAER